MNWRLLTILCALVAVIGGPSYCLAKEAMATPTPDLSMIAVPDPGNSNPAQSTVTGHVAIKRIGGGFQLYRNNIPYYIKGIGGRDFLENAAAAGANSIRTWGPEGADVLLDRARDLNMTVMLGIWLSHHASDYADPMYAQQKRQEVTAVVERYKDHPSLLIWSIGNEINLDGTDSRQAWQFVNELALLIKQKDAHHPVITVIACRQKTFDDIAAYAPDLDAVGINAYGSVSSLRAMIDDSSYNGPYLITEWGVDGHWEALQTAWGRPIEPTGTQKAEYQLQRYTRDILANSDRCMGSYVFLWGQKQERTPTWYSMFLNNLPGVESARVSLPAVDAMHFNWTGHWPANRAPRVLTMSINNFAADTDIILTPGEPMVSQVVAGDPENDSLSYIWELLEEPTTLGTGGSFEPKPKTLESVVGENFAVLNLKAPLAAGEYRLFVYVLDHNGHAGTANIPFQVREMQGRTAEADRNPSGPG